LQASPRLSALVIWEFLGGHLSAPETLNLVFGHLLYGLLVGAIALFAASVSESAATAAIMTLAFTIGSWVLDFTVVGQPGLLAWIGNLSLTQVLHTFEQGLLSVGLVAGICATVFGFAALATIWLPPGVRVRDKIIRSIVCVFAVALALGVVTQIRLTFDVTEDRRNSFPAADQRLLATLAQPLVVTVHLAPEDPRYTDLYRNVLAKLERAMPNMLIRLAGERQSLPTNGGDRYGEVEYIYGGRSDVSRSTSPREILPLLYGLAGVSPLAPTPGNDYPGYPLVAGSQAAFVWFLFGLPLCTALAWWWSRRLPKTIAARSSRSFGHENS
jgi:ABC-2 type transport system permease protein